MLNRNDKRENKRADKQLECEVTRDDKRVSERKIDIHSEWQPDWTVDDVKYRMALGIDADCRGMVIWSFSIATFVLAALVWLVWAGDITVARETFFLQFIYNLSFAVIAFAFVVYCNAVIKGGVKIPLTKDSQNPRPRKVDKMLEARFTVTNLREVSEPELTWMGLIQKYNAELVASIVSYTITITCSLPIVSQGGILGIITWIASIVLFVVTTNQCAGIIHTEYLCMMIDKASKNGTLKKNDSDRGDK